MSKTVARSVARVAHARVVDGGVVSYDAFASPAPQRMSASKDTFCGHGGLDGRSVVGWFTVDDVLRARVT